MSSYSKANKVCATCAHWGGNRNSIAGGFQVSPTSSAADAAAPEAPIGEVSAPKAPVVPVGRSGPD